MPKNQQVTMSSTTSDSSKNYVDPDWLELKKEYDNAIKYKEVEEKLKLEKEKDEFAKMWVEAGFDLKETLVENCITSNKKRH
tara:strand:+ start:1882 stop:2127 length:246 start_codon:yes stop_codon:yes gene_type:complete